MRSTFLVKAPVLSLIAVFIGAPAVSSAQNPCNGTVTTQYTGGGSSSCPGPLSRTWDFRIDGSMKCNLPGVHPYTHTITSNNTASLTATGTCDGPVVQCPYEEPQGAEISTDGSGTMVRWSWRNGVRVGGTCQLNDKEEIRFFYEQCLCSGSYCCGGKDDCIQAAYQWVEGSCECRSTPLLVVLDGPWRHILTTAERGAVFAFVPGREIVRVAWPVPGQRRAGWLVRDRNSNGKIDDGSELYGSSAPQVVVPGEFRHGFRALALEDSNGDGAITQEDAAYGELQVWFDRNHDGSTDPGELEPIASLGIVRLELAYRNLETYDAAGNEFLFEGHGIQHRGSRLRRIQVFDVSPRTAVATHYRRD